MSFRSEISSQSFQEMNKSLALFPHIRRGQILGKTDEEIRAELKRLAKASETPSALRPGAAAESKVETAEIADLRRKAQETGALVVRAEEKLRVHESEYKATREDNIRANKTFAHLFLNKIPDLGNAAEEEKEEAEKVRQAKEEYERLKKEREKIREALRKAIAAAAKKDVKDVELEPAEALPERRLTLEETRIKKDLARFDIKEEEFEALIQANTERGLTDGQKVLLLEDLNQLTLGRIQDKSYKEVDKEIASSKFLRRVWLNVSKHVGIKRAEKKTGQDLLKGGLDTHGELLTGLIGRAEKGPDAQIDGVTGKVERAYLATGHLSRNMLLSPEDQMTVRRFNTLANEYARLPVDWDSPNTGPVERRKYKKTIKEYQEAKTKVTSLMLKGEKTENVLMGLHNMEAAITLNRYLNTHPDVEKVLQNIKDGKIWTAALKDLWAEKGYIALGSTLTRQATLALLGATASTFAVPAIGAGAGGIAALFRGRNTLRRAERGMRRGVAPGASPDGRYAPSGNEWHDEALQAMGKRFISGRKTKQKTFETQDEHGNRTGEREIGDASLASKLGLLMKKAEAAVDDKERNAILAKMKVRLDFTRKQLEAGLVNFGETDGERIVNVQELMDAIGRAEIMLRLGTLVKGSRAKRVEARLEDILGTREKKAKGARSAFIHNEVWKGMVWGAAFAYVGKEISDHGRELGARWGWWDGRTEAATTQSSQTGQTARTGIATDEKGVSRKDGMVIPDELVRAQERANIAAGEAYLKASPTEKIKIRDNTGLTDEQLTAFGNKGKEAVEEWKSQPRPGGEVDTSELKRQHQEKMVSGAQYLAASPAAQAELRSVTGMSDAELKSWGARAKVAGIRPPVASGEQVAQVRPAPQSAPSSGTSATASSETPARQAARPGTPTSPAPAPQSTPDVGSRPVAPPTEATSATAASETSPRRAEVAEVKPAEVAQVTGVSDAAQALLQNLEGYKIKDGDTLWKLIGEQIPKDTEGRNQKIASLVNLIQEKNSNVDVDRVFTGRTLNISQFGITENEINEIMGGKVVSPSMPDQDLSALAEQVGSEREPVTERVTPITGDEIEAPAVAEPLSQMIEPERVSAEPIASSSEISAQVASDSDVSEEKPAVTLTEIEELSTEQRLDLIKTNPRQFLAEHPELSETFKKNLGRHLREVFHTNELDGTRFDYRGNRDIGRTLVSDAVSGETSTLHQSQKEGLQKFMRGARRVLGPLAQARAGESLNMYLGRIEAIALLVGKKLP